MEKEIYGGQITAGELREIIGDLKDSDPVILMCENGMNGVGYNASILEFYPPAENKAEAIENDEPWQAMIYLTF